MGRFGTHTGPLFITEPRRNPHEFRSLENCIFHSVSDCDFTFQNLLCLNAHKTLFARPVCTLRPEKADGMAYHSGDSELPLRHPGGYVSFCVHLEKIRTKASMYSDCSSVNRRRKENRTRRALAKNSIFQNSKTHLGARSP